MQIDITFKVVNFHLKSVDMILNSIKANYILSPNYQNYILQSNVVITNSVITNFRF
jgi:hypothetical protein